MLKLLVFTLFALLAINPAIAMDSAASEETSHKTIVLPDQEPFNWIGIPRQLTLLDPDEPITDELLLELNPRWQQLKEMFPAYKKDSIISAAYGYAYRYAYLSDYPIARNLITLAVCIGADPNYSTEKEHPILFATRNQDYWFTRYLLEKGAQAKFDTQTWGINNPVANAESVRLAKLVLDHGAEIPETILDTCCRAEYSAELLQFYLDRCPGLPRVNHKKDHESSLWHKLVSLGPDTEEQMEKACILLKIGLDPSFPNWVGNTPLHTCAQLNHNGMIALLTNRHIDQHQAYLGFLWYIKKNFPDFYRHKDMMRLCFKALSPMRKLSHLQSIKNNAGKTAYDIKPMEELNPNTCTYVNQAALIRALRARQAMPGQDL